jgi:glutathione S-transferase
MKLFYAPGACSLSPHIVLNEAGLAFDKVKVDTKSKAMDGGDYRSVNPLGYVPALELDDGTILTEGPAIVQYVADAVPGKQLAPANGTLERSKLQSWLNFISSELHKGFSPLFHPSMPPEAKQLFRERLATRFQHLDRHLADKDYLLGKTFSVADAYLFTVSNWAAHTDVDLSAFGNVLAYRKRVAARPAVQAAMKAEGLIK